MPALAWRGLYAGARRAAYRAEARRRRASPVDSSPLSAFLAKTAKRLSLDSTDAFEALLREEAKAVAWAPSNCAPCALCVCHDG